LPNIRTKSRRIVWFGYVAYNGGEERCFQGVGAISERKMPLGRLGHS